MQDGNIFLDDERHGVPPESDLVLGNVWEGWSKVPLDVGGCIGPVGGIVYIQSKGRIWTYNLEDCRFPSTASEAYWYVKYCYQLYPAQMGAASVKIVIVCAVKLEGRGEVMLQNPRDV